MKKDKKEEILERRINRLHKFYPDEVDNFTSIEYNTPQIIKEIKLAMEEYHIYMSRSGHINVVDTVTGSTFKRK